MTYQFARACLYTLSTIALLSGSCSEDKSLSRQDGTDKEDAFSTTFQLDETNSKGYVRRHGGAGGHAVLHRSLLHGRPVPIWTLRAGRVLVGLHLGVVLISSALWFLHLASPNQAAEKTV